MVQPGDAIPAIELHENKPEKRVNLADELASGPGLIIGVPAAFSPTCSDSHIPEYISHEKLSSAGKVFVVSVNDSFVMKAWQSSLDKSKASGIRFLGDPSGAFTRALDVEFPSADIFGNDRSKRYAIVTRDGKVVKAEVEPDNTGVDVSAASKILG